MIVSKFMISNKVDFKKLKQSDVIEVQSQNGTFSFLKSGSNWKLVEGLIDPNGKVKRR